MSDYTDLIPPLSKGEFEALKSDIAARGVLIPVEFDEEGNLLDGYHRLRACKELGIEDWPSIIRVGLSEEEKRDHVRLVNLARRHLNREQRRELIRQKLLETPEWSDRRVAGLLGVDHKTVASIRRGSESTGEIPHFDRTVGLDRKARPARRPVVSWSAEERRIQAVVEELWPHIASDFLEALLGRGDAVSVIDGVVKRILDAEFEDVGEDLAGIVRLVNFNFLPHVKNLQQRLADLGSEIVVLFERRILELLDEMPPEEAAREQGLVKAEAWYPETCTDFFIDAIEKGGVP